MNNRTLRSGSLTNFYLFIIGQFVSQFGTKLTSLGLMLWCLEQAGSVLEASLVKVCFLVPAVGLSFVAGSISDRWDKKKIIIIVDCIAATFSLSIILLLILGILRLEYLYVINVVLGAMDAFQNPAASVVKSLLVSKENYMKTSGIQSFCNSALGIFAPIIATSIYAFWGLLPIIIIDLMTFCLGVMSLAYFVSIPIRGSQKKREKCGIWQQCMHGVRYLLIKKDVLMLISFMAFVNFIAAIYGTILAPMILLRSGHQDVQVGIVTSVIGLAGLIGSIVVTRCTQVKRRVPIILNIMSFSFLICNSLLGIGRTYPIWMMAVFMGHVFIPLLMANVDYLMRTKVPIDKQGRVFAARNTLQYTTIPLGTLLGGMLADKVFEPFMAGNSGLQTILANLVGKGPGSGIAVLYIFIGIIGFIGCCFFRISKELHSLDHEGYESNIEVQIS